MTLGNKAGGGTCGEDNAKTVWRVFPVVAMIERRFKHGIRASSFASPVRQLTFSTRSHTSMNRIILTVMAFALACASTGFAQGVQTGTIRGMVKDQQDLPVPGVTVTTTSPALQGPRSTVTDTRGLFVLSALPAGEYTV